MKCDFCGREAPQGATECPYCHNRFTIDAKVLTPDERDTFDGVTIEEDGSSAGGEGSRSSGRQETMPRFKVRTFGCGSSLLVTLLILGGILALFFFLLPTFIVFAAIGAVVVFLLRLFM